MIGGAGSTLPLSAAIAGLLAAAAASYAMILILRPILLRIALAKPNARSSHKQPTPQGGGIAVVAATLTIFLTGVATLGVQSGIAWPQVAAVIIATLLLAVTGFADDVRSTGPALRLLLQVVALGLVIYTLPDDVRIAPILPLWSERVVLLLAGVWFVNLVNFMDGLDWMTVAEAAPVAGGLALAGLFGLLPPLATLTACALTGAMIGFAPFNRPVASLFLGDVGSVPIGLLLAWLLFLLAAGGHFAAAVLLPLYYLADTTITLGRRLARGERIWVAHRTHFYQRATDNGLSVSAIVGHVFAVNLGLAVLAAVTIARPSTATNIVALAAGAALVGWLLWRFARRR
jgi:UDP-N-acetylmuramyl pentapeptide phosphotransferase/UDP-N-acetylglucosamine-1-phosphate transferase